MAYLHNVETKTCTSSAETKISTLNIKSPETAEYHPFSPMNGSYRLLTQQGSQYVWVDQAKAEEIINERPVTMGMVKELFADYVRSGNFDRYKALVRSEPEAEPEEVENANTGE